jgi:phosphonate transport system substrate-binding protein
MIRRPLRFATFLAPNLLPLYAFIARRVGDRLGLATELFVGTSYDQLVDEAEVSFVCGLAYVELRDQGRVPIEPLAAPLLRGPRYRLVPPPTPPDGLPPRASAAGGRPVYFSDVIVRRDSPWRSFADLRGRSWSYNEPRSHSGYGITRYHLVRLGETDGYFGRVVEAGWHERSIRLVHAGEVDASAIDSQVLAVTLRDHPGLAAGLRVVDSLGPSTIQPVVVASWLPEALKADLQAVLLELGEDPAARDHLAHGLVERFVPVTDASYDDLRHMRAACAAASFLALR